MMIFVTPQDQDNRFVIYLKTSTCKLLHDSDGLHFESTPSKIAVMKDFLVNYGVKNIEIRDDGQVSQLLMHDPDVFMQLEDVSNIAGLKVPVLTII